MLARDDQDAGTRGAQLFLPPETGSQSPDNDHAYAVAVQLRSHSGIDQFVVRTDSVLQPFRITSQPPGASERILAMVA